MFDLRSNFVIKVGGKEDYLKQTAKQDRTTFLCVSQEIFENLFELFPKSKIVVQKRALERRRVFMDHLEKLEEFLAVKKKKMKILQKKRLHAEKQAKINKEIQYKRAQGIPESDLGYLVDQLKSLRNGDTDSSDDDKKKQESDDNIGTDLSDEDNYNKGDGTDMTAFDEYDTKSMDIKNVGISDRAADPEAQAKEEYMRKLMSFRKDELILPEESDDDDDHDDENAGKKEKNIAGVEDAYDLVERVEEKMNKIAIVIKGMDKRMSYNLRLIGSVIQPELEP